MLRVNENLIKKILNSLSPNLLKRGFGGEHPLSGHCYIASEAYYHLSDEELTPQVIKHEGVNHWYLLRKDGKVIDLTAKQFKTLPDYNLGRGIGFLTKQPSKRAKILMEKIGVLIESRSNETNSG